ALIVIDILALVLIYDRCFCCASINTFLIIRKDLSVDVGCGNGFYLPLLDGFLEVREDSLCFLPRLWLCDDVRDDMFLYLPFLDGFFRFRLHILSYLPHLRKCDIHLYYIY